MDNYFGMLGLPGTFVLSEAMMLYALILALVKRRKDRWFCFAGMLTSSIGDLFMTRFMNIEDIFPNCFMIGVAVFMLAHIFYFNAYRLLAKSKGYKVCNKGMYGAVIMAAMAVIYFTIVCIQRKDFSMYPLVWIYLSVISLNCAMIFSYTWSSFKKKPVMVLAAVGILAFWLSDFIIGLDVIAGITEFNYLIWWLYPIGQILVISCEE